MVSTGPARGVDGWGGSGAWVMGGLVCGYNTGPIGIPVCPLALQAYHNIVTINTGVYNAPPQSFSQRTASAP